jgi:hypothetical protein
MTFRSAGLDVPCIRKYGFGSGITVRALSKFLRKSGLHNGPDHGIDAWGD